MESRIGRLAITEGCCGASLGKGKPGFPFRSLRLAVACLFPHFCLRCGREGEVWCRNCEENYRPPIDLAACPFCGRRGSPATCHSCRGATFLDGLKALSTYGDPTIRQAITLWKYHGDAAAARTLQQWVRQAKDSMQFWVRPEAVTFVPLHERRRRARGFDQAETVAQWVAEALAVPLMRILERRRSTAARAAVARAQRALGEMDGIFQITGPVPKIILLCDDVFTSGATLDAAARTLKEAGAQTVLGFTLAKGSVAKT